MIFVGDDKNGVSVCGNWSIRFIAITVLSATIKLDETQEFTYQEWNTYCTYLRVYVHYQSYEFVSENKNVITRIATTLYGKKGDNLLVDTLVHLSDESHEVVEFNINSKNEVVSLAVEDAEQFMFNGQYDKAFDRVHTAFHRYLKSIIMEYGVESLPNNNLPKLYNKVYYLIDDKVTPQETSKVVKSVAKLIISLVSSLVDYIDSYLG